MEKLAAVAGLVQVWSDCRLRHAGLQAIKASSCYVDDISKANVVYVYDYCYYIWWLAHIHSALGEKVVDTPGDYLIKVRRRSLGCGSATAAYLQRGETATLPSMHACLSIGHETIKPSALYRSSICNIQQPGACATGGKLCMPPAWRSKAGEDPPGR